MTEYVRAMTQDQEGTLYMVDATFTSTRYTMDGKGSFHIIPFDGLGFFKEDLPIEGDADRLRAFAQNKPELFINWIRYRFNMTEYRPTKKIETLVVG